MPANIHTPSVQKPSNLQETSQPRLSVYVCAHNEANILRECLKRLRFADEIVVVLDRCTDDSLAVAHDCADIVIEGSFPVEGARRTAAVATCTGEWVLEIDADEHVPQELADEIRAQINNAGSKDWYLVPIDNYIGEKRIRYGWGGSFGTSASARLFRKEVKKWGDEPVHPSVNLSGNFGGMLKHQIDHYVDENISDMLHRFDRYTASRALYLCHNPKARHGLLSHTFRGFRRFYKCYISRRGYREGNWGVLIALLAAFYPMVSELRARLENS